MSDTPYIFDVTSADFDQLVIQNSFHKPVLVDFWADWCAPCKALMPMLAQVAESYQGELLLAKVNCDVEQDIVMRFGIRSLPTVVLFKDGQPVDGFAGAQPESAVRQMLEQHVQPPAAPAANPLSPSPATSPNPLAAPSDDADEPVPSNHPLADILGAGAAPQSTAPAGHATIDVEYIRPIP